MVIKKTEMLIQFFLFIKLQKIDEGFYAPTSDSENKLVRVSTTDLNKIMDAPTLKNGEYYFYVESTTQGYNYYIGQDVNQENGYRTTCAYATGDEACTERSYDSQDIKIINSNIFNLIHITRNDIVSSNTSGSQTVTLPAPTVDTANKIIVISDGITQYCITTSDNSGSCSFQEVGEQNSIDLSELDDGTYYIFVKNSQNQISASTQYVVSTPLVSGTNGQAVELAGYNWHIIGQDDTKIWLLMDAGQLSNMDHCNTGSSSNCTWNGSYYVYSWDKSLIHDYLNGDFYNSLPANVKSKIVTTRVCKDSSINSGSSYSYGGYLDTEIASISGATCGDGTDNAYTTDYVRLMTPSEYHNLSQYYNTAKNSYPITSVGDNGQGKIAGVSYITRLSINDWLYSSSIGWYWLTGALSLRR